MGHLPFIYIFLVKRILHPTTHTLENTMTLCPIAIVSSCEKCPAFKICPLKGVIGSPPPSKAEKPAASARPKKK